MKTKKRSLFLLLALALVLLAGAAGAGYAYWISGFEWDSSTHNVDNNITIGEGDVVNIVLSVTPGATDNSVIKKAAYDNGAFTISDFDSHTNLLFVPTDRDFGPIEDPEDEEIVTIGASTIAFQITIKITEELADGQKGKIKIDMKSLTLKINEITYESTSDIGKMFIMAFVDSSGNPLLPSDSETIIDITAGVDLVFYLVIEFNKEPTEVEYPLVAGKDFLISFNLAGSKE